MNETFKKLLQDANALQGQTQRFALLGDRVLPERLSGTEAADFSFQNAVITSIQETNLLLRAIIAGFTGEEEIVRYTGSPDSPLGGVIGIKLSDLPDNLRDFLGGLFPPVEQPPVAEDEDEDQPESVPAD